MLVRFNLSQQRTFGSNGFLDLQPDYILSDVKDDALKLFETTEKEKLCPRKADGDRSIYRSRNLGALGSAAGRLVLCDFKEARHGKGL